MYPYFKKCRGIFQFKNHTCIWDLLVGPNSAARRIDSFWPSLDDRSNCQWWSMFTIVIASQYSLWCINQCWFIIPRSKPERLASSRQSTCSKDIVWLRNSFGWLPFSTYLCQEQVLDSCYLDLSAWEVLLRHTWGTAAAALGEGKCLKKMSLRILASTFLFDHNFTCTCTPP